MQHRSVLPLLALISLLSAPAGAAELNLIADGLGLVQCLDPNAGVAGGFTAAVVRNKRVYGPVDEFRGIDLFQHTRAGAFNTDIRLLLLRAARPDLGESRFLELQEQLFDGEFLSPGEQALFRGLTATAERLRQQGKDAQAQELEDRAEDLLDAGRFDDPNTTQELLTTRPDANIFTELALEQGRPA
ncbi:MAG: hypothetical protein O7B23_05110, partial [Deltaproteobacteria bacterium]|nr:hypothetical protein [Deltaproteobacteria bacterium]